MKSAGLNAIRIPVGYWAVDVLPDEPYVTGQYPYLIQAVQWSSELGFQVMIDLHGAPGSQNGQDNSGLIGPVLFPSNSSNSDRSLDVLRNLTEEFSRDVYGGAVTAIELLNEPRLDDDNFPMSQLKDFYNDGVEVVSGASVGSNPIDIVIHGKSNHRPKQTTPHQTMHQLTQHPPRRLLGPLLLVNLHPSRQQHPIPNPTTTTTNPNPRLPPILRLRPSRQPLTPRNPLPNL
jgi:aryl-phospho-beta-D-glucosidase BglC (GH1 family)